MTFIYFRNRNVTLFNCLHVAVIVSGTIKVHDVTPTYTCSFRFAHATQNAGIQIDEVPTEWKRLHSEGDALLLRLIGNSEGTSDEVAPNSYISLRQFRRVTCHDVSHSYKAQRNEYLGTHQAG